MYEFVDTIETSKGNILPSEALRINGKWIDEEIKGYRTLSVSGRELVPWEVESVQSGSANGETYLEKRLPVRVIIVTYQISRKTPAEFRKSFIELNQILNVEEAEIIFNDENDKYFIGTPCNVTEVEPGQNSVIGEFEIYCSDPLKYSVEDVVYKGNLDNIFSIDYKGTYKTYPIIEAEVKSNTGYVGYVTGAGSILQVGNPEEMGGENVELSETLISDMFNSNSALNGWTLNNAAIVGPASSYDQVGAIKIDTYVGNDQFPGTTSLCASDYGTGHHWHGPSITKQVPADGKGYVGAKNCTLSWKNRFEFWVVERKELGTMQIMMTDKNGKNVAAMLFYKNLENTLSGFCDFYADGKKMGSSIDMPAIWLGSERNLITSAPYGRSSITKFGSTIEFNLAGQIYSYTVPSLENVEVTEVSIYFTKWGDKEQLFMNRVESVSFVTHRMSAWNEIPNRFATGDKVRVDCRSGEIYLNNIPAPDLGALGNEWEAFTIEPGENRIQCLFSDWAISPEFTLRFKEAYL